MRCENPRLKLVDLSRWSRPFGPIVATNGCFDLVHAGHIHYLYEASKLAPVLVVGLNSDQSVRALKGPTRPLQPELDRALVLASLQFVDYVVIFEEVRAVNFLAKVRPDVYVKGGDYTLDTLDPGERQVLEEARAKIHFIPVNPGKSTTQLVQKIVSAHVG